MGAYRRVTVAALALATIGLTPRSHAEERIVRGLVVAFVAVIRLDQPFGPVLVVALLGVALMRFFVRA